MYLCIYVCMCPAHIVSEIQDGEDVPAIVPAGDKNEHLLLVKNHTAKTIYHHLQNFLNETFVHRSVQLSYWSESCCTKLLFFFKSLMFSISYEKAESLPIIANQVFDGTY